MIIIIGGEMDILDVIMDIKWHAQIPHFDVIIKRTRRKNVFICVALGLSLSGVFSDVASELATRETVTLTVVDAA
jgi:hypothetical protein